MSRCAWTNGPVAGKDTISGSLQSVPGPTGVGALQLQTGQPGPAMPLLELANEPAGPVLLSAVLIPAVDDDAAAAAACCAISQSSRAVR